MLQQHRLRRLVAAGAAALIATTGVGLGTVPAFAEDAAPAEGMAPAEASVAAEAFASQPRLKGKWVMVTASGYSTIVDGPEGTAHVGYGTLTEVKGKAATLTYPGAGDYGPIKTESGRCLGLAPSDTLVQIQQCSGGPLQVWHMDADGMLTAPNARGLQHYGLYEKSMYRANGATSGSRLLMSELQPEVVQRQFSAWVGSRDDAARSVLLLGYGTPDASVTVNGGAQSTYVRETGGWNIPVTGLKLGVNTLNIEHRVNGVVTGSTVLTVQFGPDQLEANVSFPANVSERAIVSGTAEPGAEVSVWQGSTLVATASADRATGAYSTELPSPNRGGAQEYSLTQSVNNQEVPGAVSVRADYGSAVSIESPVNEIIHNGGELRFQGRGVPGGKVSLRENGRPGVLGAATVASNGIWTVTVADVAKKNLKFTAEQTGRGANVTTASVEINPGVTDEALRVITPAEGAKLQPGSVTFTGTANAGATVELRSNLTGSLLGSGVANANGSWTASVNRHLGAGDYTIVVKNGTLEVARSFSVVQKPVTAPLTVTSPAHGATLKPGTVTFTGTATPGAAIELRSKTTGAMLGAGTATGNGSWSVQVNRQLGADTYYFQVKSGSQSVDRQFTVADTPSVTEFLQVTLPTTNGTVQTGKVMFAGTANPGATIELRSNVSGIVLGRGTTNQAGNWVAVTDRGLAKGTYTVIVRNGSLEESRTFFVDDVTTVGHLTVVTPAQGATVNPGPVTFTGLAEPHAKVVLRSNVSGLELGSGTANAAGSWSATTSVQLGVGAYTVLVESENNEIARSFQIR